MLCEDISKPSHCRVFREKFAVLCISLLKPKILVQLDCGKVIILDSNPFYLLYFFKIFPLRVAARARPLIHTLEFPFETKNAGAT